MIDYFSPKADGVRIACTQFFITAVLSAIPMFLFETPRLSDIFAAAVPVLYAGVLSSGVAYTLQIVAQKDADPTVASLILSLESVFSVLGGCVILGQKLSIREIAGCILMFSAIILAQLPGKPENKEAYLQSFAHSASIPPILQNFALPTLNVINLELPF